MKNLLLRTLFLSLALLIGGNAAAQILYGANGAGGNPATVLVTINPATGVATTVGPIGFAVTGLAMHPTTGVLYGSTGGNAPVSPNSLIRINTTTGAGTLIGPTGLGGPVADIEFRANGTLFGWSEGSDELVTLNLATGAGTVVGPNTLSTFGSGLAFVGGTLYLADDGNDGVLHIINAATGAATNGPTLSGSPGAAGNPISALATRGGTLFGVDLLNSGARTAFLVTINPTTGVITNIGPTIAALDAIAFGVAAAPGDGTGIPTMSEWALILMILLMIATAYWARRKRS